MIHTIRVSTSKGPDLQGESLLQELKHFKIKGVSHVRSQKVYRVEGVSKAEAKKLADLALCESVNQIYTLGVPRETAKSIAIEIAYKPGVMNPEVASIHKAAEDLGIKLKAADVSKEYLFSASLTRRALHAVVEKLNLYNPLIEHIVTAEPKTLLIDGAVGKTETIPLRSATDEELMKLSKNTLFLNLQEMKVIQKYFQKIKRDPIDCELEVLAQSWSEHCVHKTFKADLVIDGKKKPSFISRIKSTAKENPLIISAFVDNSGVIDFYEGYGICGKVETHNSPSAIEPYGGAMTGSGGVFRDVLGTGQGAKPLISTDIFCFAPPDLPKKLLPPGCLPPDYILKRVVQGVRDYGNRVGIPTNNGSIHFHNDFRAKPTVAVGAYGIIEKSKAKKQSPKIGDIAITLGGRTGRDGIHGATFSSAEMTDETKSVSGTAVQIGNAIEEKRVIDALLIMQKGNLIHTVTDCGAGGYSSALGEMGEKTGVMVHLDQVPLKYPGLTPWEIFLSESQERMVIAIDPKNKKEILAICNTYNVESSEIAKFDGSKKLQVFYNDERICDLPMEFVHNGLPRRQMIGKTTQKKKTVSNSQRSEIDIINTWKKILADPNVCSKESIVRLYDHTVQGRNALAPFVGVDMDAPTDGAIVKPFFDKPYGLATTHGLNPILNTLDPYWGSVWAITEAVSNYVAIGGNLSEAALIDNFVWPFPDEASLADLDKAVDACVDMAKLLKMPFVSGKDSLSSTYRYPDGKILKIPPVLLISVFGRIADVKKTSSSDFKSDDSIIVFVGTQDADNMGGSIYQSITKHYGDNVPKVEQKKLLRTLQTITKGVNDGTILSCHDISEGGLATTLAEMCFGAGFGATIDLKEIASGKDEHIIFNESAGTFLVEVATKDAVKKLFKSIPHAIIGRTNPQTKISIVNGTKNIASIQLQELKKSWQQPMKKIFN